MDFPSPNDRRRATADIVANRSARLRTITGLAQAGRPIGELIAEFLEGRLAINGMEDPSVEPEGEVG